MLVSSVRFALLCVCLVAVCDQVRADEETKALTVQDISRTCFGCICEAASGCDTSAGCNGEVCGPFRITWGYWSDGGKPTLNNEPSNADGAFARCVNDPFCASQAIQNYMNRFAQDCNGDGVINCDDYVRIHRLGGYGCGGPIDSKYENRYKTCMQTFGK